MTKKTLFLLVFPLFLVGCMSTSVLVSKSRPEIPAESVKFYASAPAGAEVIGIVWAEGGTKESTINKLRKEAAKIGANALIMGELRNDLTWQASAQAIFVVDSQPGK